MESNISSGSVVCRWEFGNEPSGEHPRIMVAISFGFIKVAIPGPLVRRGGRSERSAFEFEVPEGPSKHGSNVVNRARIFQLGIKCG